MKKLKILGLIPEDNAVGYYRLYNPLKMLEKLGLAELKLTPTFRWGKEISGTTDFPKIEWFSDEKDEFKPDIIVAGRHDAPQYIALLLALKNYNVPVVVDTDDDVMAVRPFNPGYRSYKPDSEHIVWNIKLMSSADAITTSTDHLRERMIQYNKPTFTIHNSIDFSERVPERKARSKNATKEIRIGWLGSACHWENLQIIQQVVKDIVAEFPQVRFYYTNLFGDIWNKRPKEVEHQIISTCWFDCKEKHAACNKAYKDFRVYPKFINKINLDIGLAPLYDNFFNRSKSNLRVLEYWANKIAVVASNVRPYYETIVHGKNGLLATEKEEWYNCIKELILDEKKRKNFGQAGFETLKKDYRMESNAPKLYDIYNEIIRGFNGKNT